MFLVFVVCSSGLFVFSTGLHQKRSSAFFFWQAHSFKGRNVSSDGCGVFLGVGMSLRCADSPHPFSGEEKTTCLMPGPPEVVVDQKFGNPQNGLPWDAKDIDQHLRCGILTHPSKTTRAVVFHSGHWMSRSKVAIH